MRLYCDIEEILILIKNLASFYTEVIFTKAPQRRNKGYNRSNSQQINFCLISQKLDKINSVVTPGRGTKVMELAPLQQ
jgi:hypothetical protein